MAAEIDHEGDFITAIRIVIPTNLPKVGPAGPNRTRENLQKIGCDMGIFFRHTRNAKKNDVL